MARVCVVRSAQNKMHEGIHSEAIKAYHDHRNSAQERERPENKSMDELVVNRGTTHQLRNGRFRRELSQNIVISEI